MSEPRSIGSSRIRFGLLVIPVRIFSATQSSATISFNMLHRPPCSSRLKQQYVCAREEVVVPREEMVKGYECAKDQYVTFTPEELEALEEPASPTIDLSEFVPLREVDPIYFDKAYYLAPEKGAEQSYRLLAHVLQERSRTAIARHAARGKQYLVMLRPIDGRLVMQQLRYAEEVRSIDDVPMHDGRVPSRTELKLAHQLVGQRLSETFRPGDYADEVRARILADIERKVQGKEVEAVPPAEGPRAEIVDLVEALKASIEAGRPKASKPRARSRGKTAA